MVMEALRRLGKEFDDWILRGFHTGAAALDPPSTREALLGTASEGTTKGSSGITVTAAGQFQNSRTVVFRASPFQQAIRSVIHAVSLGIAYVVMLFVMSFNGYIIICVLIGGGLGKFFCDWMTRSVVVSVGGEMIDPEATETAAGRGIEEPSVCCG